MFISNTMLQLENANSNIQYSAPNVIYRDCIKSSKFMERIIGFNINGEKIFASFDEECDLSIIDELYRNKYCDTAIKIDRRILKIKKLTTAST